MSLVSDIAASQAADVAQVIVALRTILVELLDGIDSQRLDSTRFIVARAKAHQLVRDLDAGELLWPGWQRGRA